MSIVINGVNFDEVIGAAKVAAKNALSENWDEMQDIVENIAEGLAKDVEFIAKKKLSGEFDEEDAKIFLDDQKMLARIRLRALKIISMKMSERVWNAMAGVFSSAINRAIGWDVL